MSQQVIDFTAPVPRARAGDNNFAHEAASQAVLHAARHRALIWGALHEHGPLGRYAIARLTGLDPIAVARRLPELVQQGLARVCTDVHEVTPTGRRGSVWEVTA